MKTIISSKNNISALLFASLILSACGGADQAPTLKLTANQAPSESPPSLLSNSVTTAPSLDCSALNSVQIPAAMIGLPSNGAIVTSTTFVPSAPMQNYVVGDYCKVKARIKPIDITAPDIEMQLNLPMTWNRKAMMYGGGGYNGVLETFPAGLINTYVSGPDHPTPLARGYATFGSDSGHKLKPPFIFGRDASFAVNDEALYNYTGDALKKTHDTAKYLINMFYPKSVKKTYFWGGSTGGREALTVMQRWPNDFDGIISLFPAWNKAAWLLQNGRVSRALAAPGAYLNPAKRLLLKQAGIANCDGLDGVNDGLISNMQACNASFDPALATVDGNPGGPALRCTGGAELGDSCLSDAQINALKVYGSRFDFGYTLSSGESHYPGYNVWGADLGIDTGIVPDLKQITALNKVQAAYPMNPDMPYLAIYYDQWMKYFVTRDSVFQGLDVDPQFPGIWQNRINSLSLVMDSNNVNLQQFKQRGGKLLLVHGMADVAVSTQSTEDYYNRLKANMGNVKSFVRFWEIPGFGHANSAGFTPAFDIVSVLEDWVEKSKAPKKLEVKDLGDTLSLRTRPLCDFPKWPRYRGYGDVNLADSFKCVKPANSNDEEDEYAEE